MRSRCLCLSLMLLTASVARAQSDQPSDGRGGPAGIMALDALVTKASRIGLTGIVLDSTNRGIPGAEIRVYPAARAGRGWMRSHHVAVSDSTGEFFLPVVPGPYTLRVMRPGSPVIQHDLSVPPGGGTCVVVRLERDKTSYC